MRVEDRNWRRQQESDTEEENTQTRRKPTVLCRDSTDWADSWPIRILVVYNSRNAALLLKWPQNVPTRPQNGEQTTGVSPRHRPAGLGQTGRRARRSKYAFCGPYSRAGRRVPQRRDQPVPDSLEDRSETPKKRPPRGPPSEPALRACFLSPRDSRNAS